MIWEEIQCSWMFYLCCKTHQRLQSLQIKPCPRPCAAARLRVSAGSCREPTVNLRPGTLTDYWGGWEPRGKDVFLIKAEVITQSPSLCRPPASSELKENRKTGCRPTFIRLHILTASHHLRVWGHPVWWRNRRLSAQRIFKNTPITSHAVWPI